MSLAETSTVDVNHGKNRFGTTGPYKYCLASPPSRHEACSLNVRDSRLLEKARVGGHSFGQTLNPKP